MIDRPRLLSAFEKLVGFDSESFHESAVKDHLRGALEALGLEVTEDDAASALRDRGADAGNLYGFLPGTRAGAPLLFCAHMDTVSPGIGKKAVFQPDGRITSDGTTVLGADDAAALASILEALTAIRENGLPHPDIEVLFSVAEEPFCQGTSVFDFSRVRSKIAYVPDLTGTVNAAAVRAPSILSLDITVKGRAAHAGFAPEDGINALTAAARALAALPTGHTAPDTTVNFGTVSGGTGKNVVPDRVLIRGEIRSLRHEAALAQAEEVRRVFDREAEALGGSAETVVTEEIRAYSIGEDEPAVRRFREALRRLGLGPAELITTFGGSDNNNLAANGIRGLVIFSAMNDVHTVHEYTTAQQLADCAALILTLMTMEDTP